MLTILIPTYERNYFLTRKLHNLALQGCRHKIFVFDSSQPEVAQKNTDVITTEYADLDIEYRHFGTEAHFAQKLGSGIETVETPFAIVSFDDDFLNLATVETALSLLNSQPEVVSVSGHVVNFVRPADQGFPEPRVPLPGKSAVFDDPDALVRLERLLIEKRARNPLFNLWRSDVLKRIYRPVSRTPWRKFGELLFDHAATYVGPTVLLRDLLEVRHVDYQKEEYRSHGLPEFRSGLVSEFTDNDFTPLFSEMVDVCAQILEDHGYGDNAKVREMVGHKYLRHRTRRYPLSYGEESWFGKLKDTALVRLFRRGRRFGRLVAGCRSPARLRLVARLIKLHGRTATIDMIENDPELRMNYFTLMSAESPDHRFVASVYETLAVHPEPQNP